MGLRIKGAEIAAEIIEWGVEFDDGEVAVMDDETEARIVARLGEGTLVVRTVYETAWAEVNE